MVLDTSTTWSIVNSCDILTNVSREDGVVRGSTSGDRGSAVTHKGSLIGNILGNHGRTKLELSGVKHSSSMEENLIRVRDLETAGIHANFGLMKLIQKDTDVVISEILEDSYGLPYIWLYQPANDGKANAAIAQLQHQRRGHLGEGNSDCQQ